MFEGQAIFPCLYHCDHNFLASFHQSLIAGEPIRAADVRAAAARGSDLRTAATAADADADVRTSFYCSAQEKSPKKQNRPKNPPEYCC